MALFLLNSKMETQNIERRRNEGPGGSIVVRLSIFRFMEAENAVDQACASEPRFCRFPSNCRSSFRRKCSGRKMYWTDAGTRKVQRANINGTNIEDLIDTGQSPNGIALDEANGKIYWSENGGLLEERKIRRANLDGTGAEDLVVTVGTSTLKLDLSSGKMYWADRLTTGKIQRSNLDGSGLEDLITFGADRAGLALDVTGGKMYWTERSLNRVQRSNLDGTAEETLVSPTGSDPREIALDLVAGQMYWAEALSNRIRRANLDGT